MAVLGAADPKLPLGIQQARLIENLKWAAELADPENLGLCIESLSRRSLQGMLVHHIAEAYAIVKAVDSPAVRLIFDTSHVQVMDGNLLENLAATWDASATVQIAGRSHDQRRRPPTQASSAGRVAPGAGGTASPRNAAPSERPSATVQVLGRSP